MELTGSLTERRFRSNLRKLQYVLIDHPRHDDITEAVAAIAGGKPELFALESFPDGGGDHLSFWSMTIRLSNWTPPHRTKIQLS